MAMDRSAIMAKMAKMSQKSKAEERVESSAEHKPNVEKEVFETTTKDAPIKPVKLPPNLSGTVPKKRNDSRDYFDEFIPDRRLRL